jgi:hypothetical protein
LNIQEQQIKAQINEKEHIMKQSQTLIIENLPSNYNQLLLQELLRLYPGVAESHWNSEK